MDAFRAVLIYLELINLIAFALFGIDKRRAKRGKWRIPEGTLILCAVLGGGIGALAGMLVFRHKTRKPRFTVGVPVIMGMQLILALLLLWAVAQ